MSKNKRKGVRILAGFFAAMAVCTVISRAAASLLVAQVQVESVRRGRLSYTYEGTAAIVPEEEEQIFLWPGQQVEKAAEAGSAVKAGDCLVKYRTEYLEKTMDKKQAELDQLRLRKEQQEITAQGNERVPAAVSAGYALQSAQERLADAEQKEADAQAAYDEAIASPVSDTGSGGPSASDAESGAGDDTGDGTGDGTGGDAAGNSGSPAYAEELYQVLLGAQTEAQTARQSVKDAQNAYDVACRQDEAQNINDANARSAAESGVKELDIQIRQAEKELDRLREYRDAGGEIRAKQDCIVLKSPVQAGAVTTGSEVLVIAGGGWRLRGTVDSGDKETVAAGTEIEVSESQTESFKVRISAVIQNSAGQDALSSSGPDGSQADGGTAVTGDTLWYAHLPGDQEGIYQKTYRWKAAVETEEEYEQMIPLAALREDTGGNYCLVLKESSGALGTVRTAKKVLVTVLKKDGERAAVTSSLKKEDEIIVSSEKYVEEGDQVRIIESAD